MPAKKTKKIVKTVIKKTYKPNNKKIVKKFILSNKWRTVAILFMVLFSAHLLFSYNFTIKRIVLKSSEFLGLSNQSHDFEGHNIFEVNGVTYVAYEHPLVIAKVVVDPSCVTELCDVNSLKRQILTNLTPAIQFEEIVFDSAEGKRLMQEAGAKAVPAFVFDDNIKLLANFAFIEDFFIERENYYLLKTPPGRFVATPHKEKAHIKGAQEPKVIITEFSSFSCEYCTSLNGVLGSILEKYPNDVAVHYIHFNRGGNDNKLIQASECSAEQNKFWEMHDALFLRQKDFTNKDGEFNSELLSEIANTLDLGAEDFDKCLEDTDRFSSKLQNMQKVVADFGIKSSPSIFVNNSFTEGPMTKNQISEKIESVLHPVADDVAEEE